MIQAFLAIIIGLMAALATGGTKMDWSRFAYGEGANWDGAGHVRIWDAERFEVDID